MYYQAIIILANQASGLFYQRYGKKEYKCIIYNFFIQIDI